MLRKALLSLIELRVFSFDHCEDGTDFDGFSQQGTGVPPTTMNDLNDPVVRGGRRRKTTRRLSAAVVTQPAAAAVTCSRDRIDETHEVNEVRHDAEVVRMGAIIKLEAGTHTHSRNDIILDEEVAWHSLTAVILRELEEAHVAMAQRKAEAMHRAATQRKWIASLAHLEASEENARKALQDEELDSLAEAAINQVVNEATYKNNKARDRCGDSLHTDVRDAVMRRTTDDEKADAVMRRTTDDEKADAVMQRTTDDEKADDEKADAVSQRTTDDDEKADAAFESLRYSSKPLVQSACPCSVM